MKKELHEIKVIREDLIKKYINILNTLNKIFSKIKSSNDLLFSEIMNHLALNHDRKIFFNFKKDFEIFCAKAYFSHPTVLGAYKFLLPSNKNEGFLNTDLDKSILSSLVNNEY